MSKPEFFNNLSLPAVAAPMFLISGPRLVIECCKNGIVGTFPALNQRTTEGFEEWVIKIKTELEELRKNYVTKLGENIQIRRFEVIDKENNSVAGYTHNNKIGAMVILKSSDEQLSKDICMQIVASNPLALDESSIDQAILDNEKDIYKAELDKIDKKDDIKRNILEGKMKKFITENTLINQPYIKDGSLTLKKILKNNKIIEYTRYQLGEGIEKKSDDFAEEVYSQIK